MNKTVSRVLWIVAGVLLIVAGGACMLHPGAALSGLSFLLGMAMLFSGVVDIIIFATAGSSIYGSGWFLVDGILTVLLSIFLLCNQMFTMMTLPYILGMWLLFSGITKFVNSFDLRRFGVRGWGWVTAFGLLMAAAGFLLLYGPLGCGGDAVRSGGAVPDDPGRGFHRVRVSVRTVLDVKLNNKNPRSHRLTILLKRLRIEMP